MTNTNTVDQINLLNLNFLTEAERDVIMRVLQRDDELRKKEEQRMFKMKQELHFMKRQSALKVGEDNTRTCGRCRTKLGLVFNTGNICSFCHNRVCDRCQEFLDTAKQKWVCRYCHRQMQFQLESGQWFISQSQNAGTTQRRSSLKLDECSATDVVRLSLTSTSPRESLQGSETNALMRSSLPNLSEFDEKPTPIIDYQGNIVYNRDPKTLQDNKSVSAENYNKESSAECNGVRPKRREDGVGNKNISAHRHAITDDRGRVRIKRDTSLTNTNRNPKVRNRRGVSADRLTSKPSDSELLPNSNLNFVTVGDITRNTLATCDTHQADESKPTVLTGETRPKGKQSRNLLVLQRSQSQGTISQNNQNENSITNDSIVFTSDICSQQLPLPQDYASISNTETESNVQQICSDAVNLPLGSTDTVQNKPSVNLRSGFPVPEQSVFESHINMPGTNNSIFSQSDAEKQVSASNNSEATFTNNNNNQQQNTFLNSFIPSPKLRLFSTITSVKDASVGFLRKLTTEEVISQKPRETEAAKNVEVQHCYGKRYVDSDSDTDSDTGLNAVVVMRDSSSSDSGTSSTSQGNVANEPSPLKCYVPNSSSLEYDSGTSSKTSVSVPEDVGLTRSTEELHKKLTEMDSSEKEDTDGKSSANNGAENLRVNRLNADAVLKRLINKENTEQQSAIKNSNAFSTSELKQAEVSTEPKEWSLSKSIITANSEDAYSQETFPPESSPFRLPDVTYEPESQLKANNTTQSTKMRTVTDNTKPGTWAKFTGRFFKRQKRPTFEAVVREATKVNHEDKMSEGNVVKQIKPLSDTDAKPLNRELGACKGEQLKLSVSTTTDTNANISASNSSISSIEQPITNAFSLPSLHATLTTPEQQRKVTLDILQDLPATKSTTSLPTPPTDYSPRAKSPLRQRRQSSPLTSAGQARWAALRKRRLTGDSDLFPRRKLHTIMDLPVTETVKWPSYSDIKMMMIKKREASTDNGITVQSPSSDSESDSESVFLSSRKQSERSSTTSPSEVSHQDTYHPPLISTIHENIQDQQLVPNVYQSGNSVQVEIHRQLSSGSIKETAILSDESPDTNANDVFRKEFHNTDAAAEDLPNQTKVNFALTDLRQRNKLFETQTSCLDPALNEPFLLERQSSSDSEYKPETANYKCSPDKTDCAFNFQFYTGSESSISMKNDSPAHLKRLPHSGDPSHADDSSAHTGSESSLPTRQGASYSEEQQKFTTTQEARTVNRITTSEAIGMSPSKSAFDSPRLRSPAHMNASQESVEETTNTLFKKIVLQKRTLKSFAHLCEEAKRNRKSIPESGEKVEPTPENTVLSVVDSTKENGTVASRPIKKISIQEEEEDIDAIVAAHIEEQVIEKETMSPGSARSLPVNKLTGSAMGSGDSLNSLSSLYSCMGEMSHVIVSGEVKFSVTYDDRTAQLLVEVSECSDIAIADQKKSRTDPYVKVYLLPDKTRGSKRKTRVKKNTQNPTFNEILKYNITPSELSKRTLWLSVWHHDRFGHNVFLGEVTLPMEGHDLNDPVPRNYALSASVSMNSLPSLSYRGDIIIGVKYDPNGGNNADEYPYGALCCLIREAQNLATNGLIGYANPFCKVALLPNHQNKQKTMVIKKTFNPQWNHMFTWQDISAEELRESSLEITVWDHDLLSSNEFLGGVRLNLGTGYSYGQAVNFMDARGEELYLWQAIMEFPGKWAEATLVLRSSMDKS